MNLVIFVFVLIVILVLCWIIIDLSASALGGDARLWLLLKILILGLTIIAILQRAGFFVATG